jgi:hypothetical protein
VAISGRPDAGAARPAIRIRVLGDAAVIVHDVVTEWKPAQVPRLLRERETIVFARRDDGHWVAVHAPVACTALVVKPARPRRKLECQAAPRLFDRRLCRRHVLSRRHPAEAPGRDRPFYGWFRGPKVRRNARRSRRSIDRFDSAAGALAQVCYAPLDASSVRAHVIGGLRPVLPSPANCSLSPIGTSVYARRSFAHRRPSPRSFAMGSDFRTR